MRHAARDALETLCFSIKNIERTDAPTVVIAILPVIHAVLPPVTILSPPFTSDITILKSPLCRAKGIGVTTLVINVFGR